MEIKKYYEVVSHGVDGRGGRSVELKTYNNVHAQEKKNNYNEIEEKIDFICETREDMELLPLYKKVLPMVKSVNVFNDMEFKVFMDLLNELREGN